MPLLWVSLSFLFGLLAANISGWSLIVWLLLAGCGIVLWIILPRLSVQTNLVSRLHWLAQQAPHLRLPPILLLVALSLGAARFAADVSAQKAAAFSPNHIAFYNNQGVAHIQGVVNAPPDRRDRSTLLRIAVEQVTPLDEDGSEQASHPVGGNLLVMIPGRADWQYGDRLVLTGAPVTPPDNSTEDEPFSYRAYLARQNILSHLTYPRIRRLDSGAGNPILTAIYRLRDWAYAEIYHLFPAPEAPLLAGILLGIESDLPESLEIAFQNTGTAHIIAISGFNIAILSGLFSNLFSKVLPRWWAAGLAFLMISAYTLLVGAQAPVVRAAIMGSLGLLAAQLGRRSAGWAGLNTLSFTAALMCLENPYLPWNASFQLSFAATLGLMLYATPLQSGFIRLAEHWISSDLARKISGPVGEYLLFTLAAQVTTLPVILYHFNRFSISALAANPLVLPAQPLVMILSGAAVLTGLLFDPLARLLAMLAWPFSAYSIHVIEAMAKLPNSVLVFGPLTPQGATLLALAVLSPAFLLGAPARLRERLLRWLRGQFKPTLIVVLTGLLAVISLRAAITAPDGNLHITVLEQDGTAGILLQSPAGSYLLINGGSSANQLTADIGRRLPPFHNYLDGLLLASNQSTSTQALPAALERISARQVWWACELPENRIGKDLLETLDNQQIESQLMQPGDRLAVGSEIQIEVLAAGETSSALLLSWRDFRALLPGEFAPFNLPTDKAAQPGVILLDPGILEEVSPDEWKEALAPQVVILTSPVTPSVHLPANWIQTPTKGWLSIHTDGETLWAEQGR